jgi:hypothetical protein
MLPGSSFLTTLNSSSSLAQESQRLPVARVGLSTEYPPELIPWRYIVCAPDPNPNIPYCTAGAQQWYWATQELAWMAMDAFYYYLFHPDPALRSHAYDWQDLAYTLWAIPLEWQAIIGWPQNDGVVARSSSDYPQATNNRYVTLGEKPVYHVDQLAAVENPATDPYWNEIRDVIEQDFNIQPPPPPPPPITLTVSIDGPSAVEPTWYCEWSGNVSGGTPPYSYTWTGVLSGSASTVFGNVPSSGPLWLSVTDSQGNGGSTSKQIAVYVGAPPAGCFE